MALLLLGVCIAPFIAQLGGIYQFIQTMLSLFQGPMLALLVLGAITRWATPGAGLATLITGLVVAWTLNLNGMNMLYVAFYSFCYALLAMAIFSRFTQRLSDDALNKVTYQPWRRQST